MYPITHEYSVSICGVHVALCSSSCICRWCLMCATLLSSSCPVLLRFGAGFGGGIVWHVKVPCYFLLPPVFSMQHLPRTGWVRNGVTHPEDVAGHMHRMALMALLFTPSFHSHEQQSVDRERCVCVCVRTHTHTVNLIVS